ncbi:MAG: CPBP family intramembrane metalloprotease [Clostridiales bacterium]|nr:CPBP family intramembrane metalloprotease [Clostridiales bacterium]
MEQHSLTLKQNSLAKYLIRTYLIGWVGWGILILLINGGVATFASPLGFIFFAIGGYAPTIAAVSVLEKINLKSIVKFMFSANYRAAPIFVLFCLILTATFFFTSRQMQPNTALWFFPVYWFIQMFQGGFEEQGWRGIMQPALEKSMPFPLSVIVTGLVWGTWHLPLWFVAGSGQDAFPFYAFVVFCVFLSFALAVIRKKTNGVIYCCIFHAFNNALLGYIVIGINGVLLVGGAAIVIVSLLIWYADRRKSLSGIPAEQLS